MEIFERLIKYLNVLNLELAPLHLKHKLEIANKILNNDYYYEKSSKRKIPYYLNDLGVREFKSIKEEMQYLSKKYHFTLPSTQEIIYSLENKSIAELSLWLDMAIFLTGNYDALFAVVIKRYEEIKHSMDYNLLIFCGTVLAVKKDIKSRSLFIAAQNIKCAKKYENIAIAKHRLAVTDLKRFGNIQSCQNIIMELLAMKDLETTSRLIVSALANNLYALCFLLQNKDNWNKYELKIIMSNAKIFVELLLNHDEATLEEKDRAIRYLSQININYAQVLQKNNSYSEAISLLKENLTVIEEKAPFYLAEALGTLGYSLFLNNEFFEAIDILKKARKLYSDEGARHSVILINKLLLVAYYQSNDIINARKIEETLSNMGVSINEV